MRRVRLVVGRKTIFNEGSKRCPTSLAIRLKVRSAKRIDGRGNQLCRAPPSRRSRLRNEVDRI